jgi:hypothetical protein
MRRRLTARAAASVRGVKRFVVATLVLSAALLAAGCGGDDEPEATETAEWAEEFCTTVDDWTDTLGAIGDDLDDPSALSIDAIRNAAEEFDAATNDFVDRLRELGAPETASGDALESSLDDLADTVEGERDTLEQALEDVSSLTDIPGAITSLGSSLASVGAALEEAQDVIEDAEPGSELRTAFDEAEACESLRD